MSETWWTEPTPAAHHDDPPMIEAFAEGDVRVERWAITLAAPTFTVTLSGAEP